ncbi:HAD family phosphatase [Nocardioides cynanchi]|uniref:HAD family hydrolase n=1 Tax=Nocardioides cynanchi TaxID=2558918 RepID=UPI00307D3A0C
MTDVGRRLDSFAAVLWDMDGTLVDTEPYWMDSELALAKRYGGTWSREQALQVVGFDLLDAARLMRPQMGIDLAPEQIVEQLLDDVVARVRREVPWRPGARELLASLRTADVPCALVTMSYTRFADPIVAALPAGTFDVVITGDTVDRGKPHPEPYLAAARGLGVPAVECLAIEDSTTGAASASAAGCTVLVAPLHVSVPSGAGRVFVDSLEGLDAASVLGAVGVL